MSNTILNTQNTSIPQTVEQCHTIEECINKYNELKSKLIKYCNKSDKINYRNKTGKLTLIEKKLPCLLGELNIFYSIFNNLLKQDKIVVNPISSGHYDIDSKRLYNTDNLNTYSNDEHIVIMKRIKNNNHFYEVWVSKGFTDRIIEFIMKQNFNNIIDENNYYKIDVKDCDKEYIIKSLKEINNVQTFIIDKTIVDYTREETYCYNNNMFKMNIDKIVDNEDNTYINLICSIILEYNESSIEIKSTFNHVLE